MFVKCGRNVKKNSDETGPCGETLLSTLFLLNFARIKFRDFRVLEKIAKINTRKKKRARKLKSRNLILYCIRKQYINYKGCESQNCWLLS